MYGPSIKVGDLVKIRSTKLTEHFFAGAMGVVIDIMDAHDDGYVSYEVLYKNGKTWFHDYEVERLGGD